MVVTVPAVSKLGHMKEVAVMNATMKNITSMSIRIPNDIFNDIQRLHDLASQTEDWTEQNPYPFELYKGASESDLKKHWNDHFAKLISEAIDEGRISDKVAFSYLKSCYVWTGERYGFQFYYPSCKKVYARYLCM